MAFPGAFEAKMSNFLLLRPLSPCSACGVVAVNVPSQDFAMRLPRYERPWHDKSGVRNLPMDGGCPAVSRFCPCVVVHVSGVSNNFVASGFIRVPE